MLRPSAPMCQLYDKINQLFKEGSAFVDVVLVKNDEEVDVVSEQPFGGDVDVVRWSLGAASTRRSSPMCLRKAILFLQF